MRCYQSPNFQSRNLCRTDFVLLLNSNKPMYNLCKHQATCAQLRSPSISHWRDRLPPAVGDFARHAAGRQSKRLCQSLHNVLIQQQYGTQYKCQNNPMSHQAFSLLNVRRVEMSCQHKFLDLDSWSLSLTPASPPCLIFLLWTGCGYFSSWT